MLRADAVSRHSAIRVSSKCVTLARKNASFAITLTTGKLTKNVMKTAQRFKVWVQSQADIWITRCPMGTGQTRVSQVCLSMHDTCNAAGVSSRNDQWRSWGKTAGEAPEARQLVVAETILLFCEPGWYMTFPWVTQNTCENLTRITTGAGKWANRFVSTIAYNTRFSFGGI